MAQKKPKEKPAKAFPPPENKPPKHGFRGPYAPNMVARGVGAGICLFLAVLVGLGAFRSSGVVIDFLCNGIKGLVGYGFFLTLPALVIAAVLLLLQRKKRVAARLWCLGLLPILFAALLHLLLCPYQVEIAPSAFLQLWTDGRSLFGGGVLGGFLSISFVKWFSKAGAGIIFVLVILFLAAVVFHLTPRSMMARRRKRRDQREYDDFDDFDEPAGMAPAGGAAVAFDAPPPPPESEIVPPPPPPPPMENAEGPVPFRPRMEMEDRGTLADHIPFVKGKQDSAAPSSQAVFREVEPQNAGKAKGGVENLLGKGKNLLLGRKQEDKLTEQRTVGEGSVPGREEGPVPPIQEPVRAQKTEKTAAKRKTAPSEAQSETDGYKKPNQKLLSDYKKSASPKEGLPPSEESGKNQSILKNTLNSFGIEVTMEGMVCGPSVTRYAIKLTQGTRLNKVTNLADDIALALGVSGVRIAPIPNELSIVGVEVPNKQVTPVQISEVVDSKKFKEHKSSAAFAVGKDISGNCIVGDCAKLPHLLIAGTTGSGKSVCINSLIVSLLYKSGPENLRFIMVDPKMVELGIYNSIPHLLIPVVTDPKQAAGALQWAVTEMMKRYRIFAEAGVRELSSYNAWVKEKNAQSKKQKDGGKPLEPLPRVVIVIDELADLMLVAAKEVEEAICRVAQMGRAAGMHLVIATQRPSADVITGLMKANIPSRIAFAVASSLESRIILDTTGAEKLVGKGDMLWFPLGAGKPLRVQGCFISDEEVAAVVEDVTERNGGARYNNQIQREIEQNVSEAEKKGKSSGGYPAGEDPSGEQDELFDAAVDVVLELGQASVSMLQRRLKLGYARAARLVDQMEEKGIVGPFEGSKPRQMLITREQWEEMKEKKGGSPSPDPEPPVEEEILSFDPVPQRRGE